MLDDQDIASLTYDELQKILEFIDNNIIPFINDSNTVGQDLLNLFFTTFNKYVDKSDKNQAFTPDHICDFMCKAVGVNKNSRILDSCSGFRVIIVIEASSYVNIRSSRLLPKFKTQKINSWCAA
ncbi:MAG: hypothetical protein E6Y30_02445 [Finegoldia magna]|nr:hypothetical protein [Finegoldia magna]